MFWVAKRAGQLEFQDCGGDETRNPLTMELVRQADAVYGWPDFGPLAIHTRDFESAPDEYSYSKRHSTFRTVPDFVFNAWPQAGLSDYEAVTAAMRRAGQSPAAEHRVGWIGVLDRHPVRGRAALLAKEHPELLEVVGMQWRPSHPGEAKYLSLPDLVGRYAALLDMEGSGYSGRLKCLLWSGRPVLLVHRAHREFFFDALEPWVHYVPVASDLSDLVARSRWVLERPEEARAIAAAAQGFAETHLTREACYRRWDELVQGGQ
jgi:hypothetical protein